LEVILAIAILGGALATIGQLIRIGARNAAEARDLTMAQLYAESQMNRLASGVELLDTISDAPYDDGGLYVYSVDVGATEQMGVMAVTVTVKQTPGTSIHPISYSLTRWVADPEYAQTLADADAALKQAFADAQAANAEPSAATGEAAAATPGVPATGGNTTGDDAGGKGKGKGGDAGGKGGDKGGGPRGEKDGGKKGDKDGGKKGDKDGGKKGEKTKNDNTNDDKTKGDKTKTKR
jgi:hypothetical protein